ncbi:magnesium transporter [Bradyrhizobium erythrophlei]|uniref:Magnesium transporter MgtE n=1 Tax=Bradyrhizobium erythrophlei TaxID=1437360 RepID=A0A1M5PXN3_9BRAD|nr:magnesium transporter [Bradyrhizobium erythrophlei]
MTDLDVQDAAAKADDMANPAFLAASMIEERAADIVEALNDMPPELAVAVLLHLPPDRAIEGLDQPGLEREPELITLMPRTVAAKLLAGVSADRLADIFRQVTEPHCSELLDLLDPDTRVNIRRLLEYPKHTAGSIMTTEFASVPSTYTVGQTLDYIRHVESSRETVYAIYVLDPLSKKLVKTITLRRLITGDPEAPVLSVARQGRLITATPLMDREDVARLISKYDLLAVPVVDHGRVIGIVTVDDVIDAIVQESTEDVQKFGGMAAINEPYMEVGFWQMMKKRGGWLCALFLSEMLTASAMQGYEGELEKAIVLTLFIPLIMSSGGNSGSQATSLLIRALALRQLEIKDWWRVALREIPSGLALGAVLGLVGIVRIALWQYLGFYDYGEHWMLIALTVAATLVGIVMFGSLTGSMLPFVLQRIGFDPASASAPFVATLVDVTGLVIYFTVASLILRGTLL